MSPLLAFQLGSHPDHRGRMLAEIVRQDDDWLESTHDYIQWLFPLAEPSRVAPDAPLLCAQDVRAFRTDPLLRSHLLAAWQRMLAFYGLRFVDGKVVTSADWAARRRHWFTEPTHNNLRITRILKSLTMLGLEAEARAFHDRLEALCSTEADCGVPAESRRFWARAVAGGSTAG